MANYRGEEGSVKFKNASGTTEAVVQTTSWTLDLAKEVLETTVQGSTARTYVGGLISGSGSIEFNYTAATGNETKNLIDDVLVTEDAADAQFELYIDTSGAKKWSFSGIITGISASTTVGELTSVSATYQASGAITSAV
tara:strand:- start:1089 stop:1505 length:417 start_codon:yes stop_codon:yes gene_type:complete